MNPVSWKVAYTGMIRSVASWSVTIGWSGHEEWKREMTLLRNSAFRKELGVVKGSSGDKVNAIATMEGVEVFAKTAPRRFLARTLCDPLRAGI